MLDDGTSRGRRRDDSPPRTPRTSRQAKGKAPMRALNTRPARNNQTFFDDSTPVDNLRVEDGGFDRSRSRDSHDLSFGDGTRDSVVDNMLMSLDSMPMGMGAPSFPNNALYSKFDHDDFFASNAPYALPKASRHRGHTYTSSYSSEYDVHIDDTASRYSSHHSRGRRSNSSSNFQAGLARKESLRGPFGASKTSSETQSKSIFDPPASAHTRSGGKKGSKGSGSSSMDFGYTQAMGTHRMGFGNRSASFDHSYGDRPRPSPIKQTSSGMLDRGRPLPPGAYNHYDAAPEPTVPVGPRRVPESPILSPSYPPQPTYAPPQAPVSRKNSIRSSSGKTLRKGRTNTQSQVQSQESMASMRAQASDFINASHFRDLPPIPAFADPPAPSPTVAIRKPSTASPTVPTTPLANPPKEKQGFFRRVFGSSKANHASPSSQTQDASPAQHTDSYDSPSRPKTTQGTAHNHIASQLKPQPKPVSQPVPAPVRKPQPQPQHQPPPPAILNKKPSSFFRRRKKSVSEGSQAPVMPMQLAPTRTDLAPALPSPSISSLRKVMNPYLSDVTSPHETYFESREHQPGGEDEKAEHLGGFSPGYTPHKDATSSHAAATHSPKLKLKMKRGRTSVANPHDDSFLADSSGNEDRQHDARSSNSHFGLPDDARRPRTSPTSPAFRAPFPVRSNENEAPQRKANTGEKRTELLSPHASDRRPSSASDAEDDGWVVTGGVHKQSPVPMVASKPNRVWLEPTPSEERLAESGLSLPLEGVRSSQKASPTTAETTPTSTSDVFQSATSLPVVQVDGDDLPDDTLVADPKALDASEEPTDEDREHALKIYSGDEELTTKAQAATVLGDVSASAARIRKAYMDLFDWSGFNILLAMRDLCGKLVLKAETQQVDRILMAFTERWCECNPSHGFKATDVVHTICYSVLLLNTDLHLADIESRMTRSQFVRNTLPTIRRVCADALVEPAEETLRPQSTQARGSIPWSEPSSPAAESPTFAPEATEARTSLETKPSRNRLSIRPAARTGSDGLLSAPDSAPADNCNVLVKSPFEGSAKGWEFQVEIVLKEFYNSIRQQRLPLHGSSAIQRHDPPSSNNLSVSSMLRRTPSVLSKAPSDSTSYRGRSQTDFRSVAARWNTKTRSRPRLYPTSTIGSSRTSLDDQSVWSPAGSSTWSKYSFGKTQTSMSMESLGSHFARGDYQQSIGFANALSQAIIREEGMTIASSEEYGRVVPLLEDETLELVGAPWAKEGILKHKHHLEALDKKAKDRNWNESFAVIEKGYMRLFSFSMNSKSVRQKNKARPSAGSIVGGGNWMDNAEALDSFLLRQSIASALPPPGYSKSRPHVWALSLPTGAVHLFQVGTPDIVKEFVTTANYWSARLSKEPLMGGVSNIEYGWGDNVINPALIRQDSAPSVSMPRPSMQSSIRSSIDHSTGTVKARLAGDKVNLNEWTPPTQSMLPSNLMEVDQLRALTAYVKNVEEELGRHQELRAPMLIAFSPRHPNASKAMANWERKSSYLLREIVKFRTYIDSLNAAQARKEQIYAEREAEIAKAEADEAEVPKTSMTALEGDGGASTTPPPPPTEPAEPLPA
ncbi:uncharacterized protein BDZ99DRAFT_434845 [Mytilinidion resinicola]|uniref:SEC7 domain-containing protein n=1 Tax=Mytilinidion resinicola TaxID=574789 RepID=A0A6A6Z2K5_9PEZI|nr:uncharacterized protein BDZ99DRAFT_434845 [Mytilinidion resinicola]KAF2814903.1 hypothetical protein BDZ99DRAFT_434845 [Mytilinidion resinicola]